MKTDRSMSFPGDSSSGFPGPGPWQAASVYLLDSLKGVDMQTEKIIVRILKEMESRGKTILVVHHALRTVPLYFDHVAMINRRLIAAGSVRDVFTEENIEKTFSPSKGV